MKAIFALFGCLLFQITFAQKFGYVDMSYVLNRMPAYQEAQLELEKLASEWEKEIAEQYVDVDAMVAALKAEEVLLTKEIYEERVVAIDEQRKQVKEFEQQIFGRQDGLYWLKKKELIKPVQDQVFEAVEIVAKNNRLSIVFDKSGEPIMIYTDPIHDYTDFVLEELELEQNKSVNK